VLFCRADFQPVNEIFCQQQALLNFIAGSCIVEKSPMSQAVCNPYKSINKTDWPLPRDPTT
jgi:hypothetical protein